MGIGFRYCDPEASFPEESVGSKCRRIIDSLGKRRLDIGAWKLGRTAYERLQSPNGERNATRAELRDFVAGLEPILNEFFSELSTAHESGRIKVVDEQSSRPYEGHLQWRDADWGWRATTMLRIIVQSARSGTGDSDLRGIVDDLGPCFLVAALVRLDDAVLCSLDDDAEGVSSSTLDAAWLVEQVASVEHVEAEASKRLARLDSERASARAKRRHLIDPKQAAKQFVFECWQAWEGRPAQYRSVAAFARAMLDKQPDVLQSEAVVCRWVREWRKTGAA